MGWSLSPELSRKCREFVIARWGHDGLEQVMERPVTWVRHEANPHLKQLRRRWKRLPLIAIRGGPQRLRLELSTERKRQGV